MTGFSNTTFLDACRLKEPEHTPIWFMRQAGRYLPSYREIKGNRHVTELAKNPELASRVVVDAVRTLGVDAGIIFADIMLPLEGMSIDFKIEEDVGPIVTKPVRTIEDVDAISEFEVESDVWYILDGIDLTVQKLDDSLPLIGFSGAPFTLASYLIEGRPSRQMENTKMLMYSEPEVWFELMRKLTRMVKEYLNAQIRHGVSAIQLFDSWAGFLSPQDYEVYVQSFTHEIFQAVQGVPKIHFCADSAGLIECFQKAGAEVLSVDWRIPIDNVWERCGDKVSVQGNLDPVVAVVGGHSMERAVHDVLSRAAGHKGHIFSLGHGVLKQTSVTNLRRLVEDVHRITRRDS
jgi:uroporphyrinogen decarboxylase